MAPTEPHDFPSPDSISNKVKRENNIGGVDYAVFLPMKFISAIPDMDSTNNSFDVSAITLNTVDQWWRIDFSKETATLTANEKSSPEGIQYEIILEGYVAKDYDSRFWQRKRFANQRFLIIAVDYNNNARMIGYIDIHGGKHGATIAYDFIGGTKPEDLQKVLIKAHLFSPEPPAPAFFESLPVDPGFPVINTHPGLGFINPIESD